MKIACNYYNETERLFDEGRIDIDYFKYPGLAFHVRAMESGEFEGTARRVTQKRPILLHGLNPFPHDLSSETLQSDFDSTGAERLIKLTRTPGVSFHPSLSQLAVPYEQAMDIIIGNARFLKEKYSHMEFVSVENVPNIKGLEGAETVRRIIYESGCGFILDISHAYESAKLLGEDFYKHMSRLPLDHVTEIHINGWIEKDGGIMPHTMIHEEGYKALEYALDKCCPSIITVEYGRGNDKLGAGIPTVSADSMDIRAMEEIEIQVSRVREICERRGI